MRKFEPHFDPSTWEMLREIPRTEDPACLAVVRGLGAGLLPTVVMVVLHEANTVGDVALVEVLQKRLLGTGGVDGVYYDGVANPLIEGWAHRLGYRDSTEVADVRQECHLRMARHIQARKGWSIAWEFERGFRLALSGIAKDTARHFQRKWGSRGPRTRLDTLDAPWLVRAQTPDPLSALLAQEDLEALEAALRRLPPAHAEVLRRHDIEGESFAAMAREKRVDEGTLRYYRRRGLQQLGIDLDRLRDPMGGEVSR